MTEEDLSAYSEEQAEVIAANYDLGFNDGRRYQQRQDVEWWGKRGYVEATEGQYCAFEVLVRRIDWQAFKNQKIE